MALPGAGHNSTEFGGVAGDRLKGFIARIERLEEEKKAIADDIKVVKAEAKSAGFDTKVINSILRERRMEDYERVEFLALTEIYRAALGMLGSDGLSEAARKHLGADTEPEDPDGGEPDGGEPEASPSTDEDEASEVSEPEPPPVSVDDARAHGGDAAAAGAKVTSNPWPFGDPRRAAWDEGWCAAAGSDGMEAPEAWRRRKKRTTSAEES